MSALLIPFQIILKIIAVSAAAALFSHFPTKQQHSPSDRMPKKTPCLVGMCTSRHSQLLEEHGAIPSINADYCLLLKDYLSCLNDSFPTCLSQLDFHSAFTAASKRWRRFQCQKFEEKTLDESKCHFWEEEEAEEADELTGSQEEYEYGSSEEHENDDHQEHWEEGEDNHHHQHPQSSLPICSIFGQLHLFPFLNFPGLPEQCKFTGARPLFDSRFFLVQITALELPIQSANSTIQTKPSGLMKSSSHVISKVAIIIRPREGCVPERKVYLADANDPGRLPDTFVDGTVQIEQGPTPSKKVVEIVADSQHSSSSNDGLSDRVDILLNHLATTIRIRKFANKFLTVFIKTPKRLLNMNYESKNLCIDGCLEAMGKKKTHQREGEGSEEPIQRHRPSCEEEEEAQRAKDYCVRLLAGRPDLPLTEWMRLCTTELRHSTLGMVPMPTWVASFRAMLDDLFGKARRNETITGEVMAEQEDSNANGQIEEKINSRCPSSPSVPFPDFSLISSISTSSPSSYSESSRSNCILIFPLLSLIFSLSFFLFPSLAIPL